MAPFFALTPNLQGRACRAGFHLHQGIGELYSVLFKASFRLRCRFPHAQARVFTHPDWVGPSGSRAGWLDFPCLTRAVRTSCKNFSGPSHDLNLTFIAGLQRPVCTCDFLGHNSPIPDQDLFNWFTWVSRRRYLALIGSSQGLLLSVVG